MDTTMFDSADSFASSAISLGLWLGVVIAGALWLYALIDVLKNVRPEERVGWILVIIFVPVLGPLIYLCADPNSRRSTKPAQVRPMYRKQPRSQRAPRSRV